MLALIAREIRDQMVYIGACCSLSAIMIGSAVSLYVWSMAEGLFLFSTILMSILFLGFCILGASQMYADQANRISVLLSTMAVTRSRILAARVLVGALTVVVSLIPFIIAIVILLQIAIPPVKFYARMVWEISVSTILTGFACYCIGLLIGWTSNRSRLILGTLLGVVLMTSILVAKGFGPGVILLLLLFIAAALTHTWHKFTSVSF